MAEKKGAATRYGMPVDRDGNVPEQALISHMHEYYDRKQHEYDLNRLLRQMAGLKVGPRVILEKKDYQTTCDRVIPLPVKPGEARGWWEDPSSCDIEDIDTMGAPKVNIPEGFTAAQKKNMGRIKVIASPVEEQMLRRELVMSFPPEDISAMAATSPVMKVVPMRRGVTGDYTPKTNVIQIDRRRGLEQGTIVHESTHELRHTDKSRHGPIVSANRDVCIEESCTVAEQMARSDRPDYNGYYARVAVWDEGKHLWRRPTLVEARRMAEEDHLLFTEGRGKGLDGSAAIHSVQDHWADSHIARLRIGGSKMAINALADQTGTVQRLSKAQPRTVRESELPLSPMTNATAGRPGVAVPVAAKRGRIPNRRLSNRKLPSKNCLILVDESGDPGTKEGSSRAYVVVAGVYRDRDELVRIVKETPRNPSRKKESNELKYADSSDDCRLKTLGKVMSQDPSEYAAIHLKTSGHVQGKKLYKKLLRNCVGDALNDPIVRSASGNVEIVTDYNRLCPGSGEVSEIIKGEAAQKGVKLSREPRTENSEEYLPLQAHDFPVGAIANRYNSRKGDDIFEPILGKHNIVRKQMR